MNLIQFIELVDDKGAAIRFLQEGGMFCSQRMF